MAKGWRSEWSGARTTEGGTRGGTAICSPVYLKVSVGPSRDLIEGTQRLYWTVATLIRKSCQCIVVSVYLTGQLRYTGENVSKLAAIASMLSLHRLPFAIVGDWNMTPAQLMATGWPQSIESRPLIPEGCEIAYMGLGHVD